MDCSALESATLYERLNKDPALWWVLCGVEFSGAKPTAFIQYEGGSTLEDMTSRLSDDAISYGCFKVLGVDTKGAITSTRTKFVCFQWVGPRVSKLKTAKCIPAKAEIFKYFQGHHLSLELYDKSTLTEADIEKRLRAAGGAHQPSDMQFPGGGHEVKVVTEVPVTEAAGGGSDAASPNSSTSPRAAAAAPSSSSSGGGSAAAAAAPAKAALPASSSSSSGGSGSGSGSAAAKDPKIAAKVARAGEEAGAAALAIGRAAARLEELLKGAEGGQVSVADLEKLVAAELAAAALRAAAAVAVIAEAK